MLPGDPNGLDWHEPRCPDCGRYDANCKCDWPIPPMPPREQAAWDALDRDKPKKDES